MIDASGLAWAGAHPVLGSTLAGVVAGIVALFAGLAGLPDPFPVVIGLAVVTPILAVVGLGRAMDVDAYRDARGPVDVALDVGLSVAAAAALGSVVAVLAGGAELGELLLVGVALAGTIAGGYGAFAIRTRAFRGRGEVVRGDNG